MCGLANVKTTLAAASIYDVTRQSYDNDELLCTCAGRIACDLRKQNATGGHLAFLG